MWKYTDKVIDHFLHPRNVGEIENPDGTGEVGSLACGDMLRLTFKLDNEKKHIKDAKFKTFGCASAIASSSALTEMIKGLTLDQAEKLTNRDIANFLGGLPEEKMHCSVMGREALEAAIKNYRGEAPVKHELEGKVICKCFGVTDKEIERVAKENNLTTIEQVTDYTKAGGGCQLCHEEIQHILDKVQGKQTVQPTTTEKHEWTNLQIMHRVEELMNKRIRPALKYDSGDLELVDVDHYTVFIRLKGACASCPHSDMTISSFIEKELQKEISPDIKVKEVK
ncbi:MAG: Fe-S cluster assembly protein NifU [Pseudomonadota bacterium]